MLVRLNGNSGGELSKPSRWNNAELGCAPRANIDQVEPSVGLPEVMACRPAQLCPNTLASAHPNWTRIFSAPLLDVPVSGATPVHPDAKILGSVSRRNVAAGEKIPRKGGPGITRSDLLIINKIDLAPLVGADLEVMRQDTLRMRGERPFVFTNLKTQEGMEKVVAFITSMGGLAR